jgi:hypothetical protein
MEQHKQPTTTVKGSQAANLSRGQGGRPEKRQPAMKRAKRDKLFSETEGVPVRLLRNSRLF